MSRYLVSGLLAMLVAASSAQGQVAQPGARTTAVVCSQTAASALNPAVSPDLIAGDLRALLFTTPMRYGARGDLVPHAVRRTHWSADKKTLTLELRDDLHWHDRRPLTGEDLAWTLRTAADRAFGIRNAHDLQGLKDVKASGNTVVLEFAAPLPGELELLTSLPILPKHLLANVPAAEFARADYHRAPVGSGPFRFVSRGTDNTLVFERFDAFPVALARPSISRLTLRAIPEISAALVELQTGGVDMCITGAGAIEQLRHTRNLRFLGIAPSGVTVIPLNTTQPVMQDVRVRRALSAALNRSDLAAIVSPVARAAQSLMPPQNPFANERLAQPDNDPRLANRLLDEAGWKRRGNGIRINAAGEPLRIKMIAPQQLAALLTMVQAQWRQVGVDLDMQLMEWASYVSTVLMKPDGRPDAMALGLFPDRLLSPDYFDQLHSTSPRNLSGFRHAVADSVLQQLRIEPDSARRRNLYHTLQRIVQQEAPTLYLILTPRLALIGPRLQNVQFDQNGAFSNVAQWTVRR